MARIARPGDENLEVDFSTFVADLEARLATDGADLLQVSQVQNKVRGYDRTAMKWLLQLHRQSPEKFESIVRTLRPGLDAITAHKRGR